MIIALTLLGITASALPAAPPHLQAQTPAQTTPPAKQDKAEKERIQHDKDIQSDKELGKKYAEMADKEYKLSTNADFIARVQKIGTEMANIANANTVNVSWGDPRKNVFDYEFKVVKGEDVNAFSIPGGHLYVFEGLLKTVESDDELAGVLAHEVAHASLRHVATLQREYAKVQNFTLPLILIAIFTGGGGVTGDAAMLGQLFGQAKASGWSVQAEEAADYAGFQYMLKSHYNPTGMLTFMERLAVRDRAAGNIDWGIYKTHPPSQERAFSLIKYMGAAGVPVSRSKVTTTWRATVKPGERGTVTVYFGKKEITSFAGTDALKRADDAASKLNEYLDQTPEIYETTAGKDGQIIGRGKPLFTITEEDAKAAEVTFPEFKAATLKNMRMAIFNLGYRVWDTP